MSNKKRNNFRAKQILCGGMIKLNMIGEFSKVNVVRVFGDRSTIVHKTYIGDADDCFYEVVRAQKIFNLSKHKVY